MGVFSNTSVQPVLNKLARVDTKDPETAKLQDRLDEFIEQFGDSKIILGRLLTGVAVVSGSATEVSHGLGRKPKGMLVVNNSVQVDVWQPTASDSAVLYVQASANATIDLWVF